jgi:hypothetical protein
MAIVGLVCVLIGVLEMEPLTSSTNPQSKYAHLTCSHHFRVRGCERPSGWDGPLLDLRSLFGQEIE